MPLFRTHEDFLDLTDEYPTTDDYKFAFTFTITIILITIILL